MKLWTLLSLNLVIVVCGRQITSRHSKGDDQPRKGSDGNNRRRERNDSDDNRGRKKDKDGKWLVDSIYYDDYQSDGPATTIDSHLDSCPPVPDVVSESACAGDSCHSDADCHMSYRCCFNGCAFSCLLEVQPAPVVDWRKEPRRSRSGISWLIDGPSITASEAEPCTTFPVANDEDPLLCPYGYYCHMETPSNKKKSKKQTRGYCVKQTNDKYSPGEEQLVITSSLKARKICNIDKLVLLEGASIRLRDKQCRCKKGFLSCTKYRSRKRNRKVKVRRKSKKSGRRSKKDRDGPAGSLELTTAGSKQ